MKIKPKKASKELKQHIKDLKRGRVTAIGADVLEAAVSALDKQTEKCVKYCRAEEDERLFVCPTCGEVIVSERRKNYSPDYYFCFYCGQKLNWSADDEQS